MAAPKKSTREVEAISSPSRIDTNLNRDVQKAIDGVRAARGNSNSGGSLSLANQLLQQRRRLANQIPAYQLGFVPAMQRLSEKMPVLAKFLDERIHELSLYVIPIELQPLAVELTGLPFLVEHPAVQSPSDRYKDGAEIYIAESSLKRGIEMQTNMLVNEVVESIFMTASGSASQRATAMKSVKDFSYLILNHQDLSSAELKNKLIRAASNGTYADPENLGKYVPSLGGAYGGCDFSQNRVEVVRRDILWEIEKKGFISDSLRNDMKSLKGCQYIPLFDDSRPTYSWVRTSDGSKRFDDTKYRVSFVSSNSLSKIRLFDTIEGAKNREETEQKFLDARDKIFSQLQEKESNLHHEAKQVLSKLKSDFDSSVKAYSEISNSIYEKLETVCSASVDPHQFDRNTQTIIPLTSEQQKQFIQKLAPALYQFAEKILVEYYRTSYMSSTELKQRGLDTDKLEPYFHHSFVLQMLLLDDLRNDRLNYFLTPENWNGSKRPEIKGEHSFNTSGFQIYWGYGGRGEYRYLVGYGSTPVQRVLNSEEYVKGVELLDLRLEGRDIEYYLTASRQMNQHYCNRLPQIRNAIDRQASGKFEGGLSNRFSALVPKRLMAALEHLESKGEITEKK